jgi:hypothetical protein
VSEVRLVWDPAKGRADIALVQGQLDLSEALGDVGDHLAVHRSDGWEPVSAGSSHGSEERAEASHRARAKGETAARFEGARSQG